MSTFGDLAFPALILLIAVLYASVGQAGASGYLAAMGLLGLSPEVMKPTALALNLLVAAIGTVQFWRAGLFSWRTFYPFGILGFPFSILGGATHLPTGIYYPVVGAVLLLAAFQMLRTAASGRPVVRPHVSAPFIGALLIGGAIGFLSGLTGTGGGIFLAPIILMMGWGDAKSVAPVAAAYNLLNSAAALAGASATLVSLPTALPAWLLAAGVGAVIGSTLGSRYLPERVLHYILAGLLVVSGSKLLLS